MSILAALALVSIAQDAVPRRPLTLDDALFTIPAVTGRVQCVRDCDGDGRDDLVMERGGEHYEPRQIDLVSSDNGRFIRTLWRKAPELLVPDHLVPREDAERVHRLAKEGFPVAWDARGDADGDGLPDLVVGFIGDEGRGRVKVVSGKTTEALYTLDGEGHLERLGASIAFVGDLDGDGADDFACGAPEANALLPRMLGPQDVKRCCKTMEEGERDARAHTQACLSARSTACGFVSVRSGRTGQELSRFKGTLVGHGFGSVLAAIGDVDGDGAKDLIAQCDPRSAEPVHIWSLRRHTAIRSVRTRFGPAAPAGDLDADGKPDLVLEELDPNGSKDRMGASHFVSGKTGEQIFELPYPDLWSPYGVTAALGDMDGDGHDDIAFGEPNYNLGRPCDEEQGRKRLDLAKLTLAQALALESDPWCAFTWESGYAVVHSGKSREVILGVWAPPGSRRGLGLSVTALPDVSGDGHPDLLVTDEGAGYAFAGPGPARK
jgi:hypothetical protein